MKKVNYILVLNVITFILFLVLPYYLFEGKLFIGGDDSRLFYSYPYEFLRNVVFFSWINVSTLGTSGSQQFLLPFVTIWSIVKIFINNPVILNYLAFSLPLGFGFIFFQKFAKILFSIKKDFNLEVYVGSLFYVLSPILIIDQYFIFLTAVWLVFVIPALGYLYVRYLETSNFRYIYLSMIFSFVLSFTFFTMPWLFGFLLPVCIGAMALIFFYSRKDIFLFIRKSAIYLFCMLVTHSFWIFGFISPYILVDKNSNAFKFVSKVFLDTFPTTILATAKSYINFPFLNLFQRQIAFDFSWQLRYDFLRLYDKTFILNFVFVIVLAIGVLNYKRYLDKQQRRIFLFVFISFLLSLYFFVVNIGPLKDLFLVLGKIPGFVMFRNFYDKFAPGYVLLYSMLITISLILFKKTYPRIEKWSVYVFLAVVLLNFSTIISTINSPLWTTENVNKNITIPQEYFDLMTYVNKNIPTTNTILSVPFGTSSYTVIKDVNSDNVYVGISPVKIFSNVNDLSGMLSLILTEDQYIIGSSIYDRKYTELNTILNNHVVNYVLVTKNTPPQVLESYIYGNQITKNQDEEFLKAITDKKIYTSANGNYELYTAKNPNSVLETENMVFRKINAVTYEASVSGMTKPQSFAFHDSYNIGWKIYLKKNAKAPLCDMPTSIKSGIQECKEMFRFFDFDELAYLWRKPIFEDSHASLDVLGNGWELDPIYIKNHFSRDYYTINDDGSINIQFVLYYMPQLFFYYGAIASGLALVSGSVYMIFRHIKKK
jgi:hypothetical protein